MLYAFVLFSSGVKVKSWVDYNLGMHKAAQIQVLLRKILGAIEARTEPVNKIYIAIGEIAELDQNLIQKQWDELSRGTSAERAQLHFRSIKAEVQCMACFQKYQPVDGKIHCPYCGSYGAKVLSGEEFYLESIELDDEQT